MSERTKSEQIPSAQTSALPPSLPPFLPPFLTFPQAPDVLPKRPSAERIPGFLHPHDEDLGRKGGREGGREGGVGECVGKFEQRG